MFVDQFGVCEAAETIDFGGKLSFGGRGMYLIFVNEGEDIDIYIICLAAIQ